MARPEADELPIFSQWIQFLEWLLPTMEKFPKRVRYTFADRITNLALDIAEDLVVARYSHDKQAILRGINLKLEKLRVLLRLSHRLCYMPRAGYEHAARSVNEVGCLRGAGCGLVRRRGRLPGRVAGGRFP